MPERPPGDYDWLYEPSASPAPGAAAPKPSPTSDLPPPVLPPPKRPVKAKLSGPTRPSLPVGRRTVMGLLIGLPAAWIVYLAIVPVLGWANVATVEAWPDDAGRPADQPGTTYLIVGSDSRKGLSEEQQKDLKTGADIDMGGNGRTDTIMLLHTGAGKPTLVSIPRDSLVAIPGYSTTKINAAYSFGGPQLLVQTLEQNTGLRIDRYVEIGFAGVVSLVDAVGGVEICPEEDMDDDKAGLDIKKGCQEADGKTALGYARSRQFANGDIQRVQNQREVIGGLGGKIRSPATVLDPIRYFRVVTGGAASVSVDDTAGIPAMARFALALSSAMGDAGRNCNVPISDLAVHWDVNRAPQFFEHLRTDTADELGDLCTKDGLPPS